MNPTTQNEKNPTPETHARTDHAAERTKQGVSDAVGSAMDKVDKAADRIEEGLHYAADVGAQGAHRVADKAGEWHDRSAELASEARNRAGQATENLREWVREKPVQSIAVALALGWLAGRLPRPHG